MSGQSQEILRLQEELLMLRNQVSRLQSDNIKLQSNNTELQFNISGLEAQAKRISLKISEMQDAGLDAEAIRKRRQDESYEIIREFEKWMDSVSNCFAPKSRMGKALVYTYTLMSRLGRYVLDGRYHIDNNGMGNAIRPLAIGRKNHLFCNHDAAVRAAIGYSLFSSCKAHGIDTRTWLEDTLKRLPTKKDIDSLLPCNLRK